MLENTRVACWRRLGHDYDLSDVGITKTCTRCGKTKSAMGVPSGLWLLAFTFGLLGFLTLRTLKRGVNKVRGVVNA